MSVKENLGGGVPMILDAAIKDTVQFRSRTDMSMAAGPRESYCQVLTTSGAPGDASIDRESDD